MAKNSISKISNAFSTGGGGVNFEQQIQAMFLLSLLIDGFCPAMNEQTKKVHFQAKHLGYDVDDLVVITYRNQSEGKMACQIKHSITATEKDKTFQEVICAAWNDFNKEDFDRDRDRIALVTAQISNKAQQSLRFLHVEAIGAIDAEAFMERIDMPVFSNNDNQKMLAAIKECISLAKGCEPTNEEVWKFCKAFILLLFDMDCAESVNRALSASLIKCNSPENPILVWSRLTPGIDWNGNFDAKRFDYWMKTVKTWSRDNDRYEVAMHTVGSGLSYAELDEDKLPQTAIIEELNRVENEELRRGYYLGIINQRGVHWIDPEGKPELELAEDYENRANIAESRGYSRYADILRVIADEFKREAKRNILEARNGDDE